MCTSGSGKLPGGGEINECEEFPNICSNGKTFYIYKKTLDCLLN